MNVSWNTVPCVLRYWCFYFFFSQKPNFINRGSWNRHPLFWGLKKSMKKSHAMSDFCL